MVAASWSRVWSISQRWYWDAVHHVLSSSSQSPTAGRRPPNYPRSVTKTTRPIWRQAPAFTARCRRAARRAAVRLPRTPASSYFYPAASTRDAPSRLVIFATIWAISPLPASSSRYLPDKPEKLATFRDAQGLTFPLLSQSRPRGVDGLGCLREKQMYGRRREGDPVHLRRR